MLPDWEHRRPTNLVIRGVCMFSSIVERYRSSMQVGADIERELFGEERYRCLQLRFQNLLAVWWELL
jgi:hypothetical protein